MNEIITVTNTPIPMVDGADNEHHLLDLWLHGRSPATQRGYRAEAERFLRHVSKHLRDVTLGDLQGYSDALDATGLQPATHRRMLASVKSLFSFGHKLGYLRFDTA